MKKILLLSICFILPQAFTVTAVANETVVENGIESLPAAMPCSDL